MRRLVGVLGDLRRLGWLLAALGCSSAGDGTDKTVVGDGSSIEDDGTTDVSSESEQPLPLPLPLPPRADFDQAPDEGAALTAHSPPFAVSAGECVLTRTSRSGSPAGWVTRIGYTRRSYDPERQLLSEIPVDNRGEPVQAPATRLYTRFGQPEGDGLELMFASSLGDSPLKRTDYARDEHGNLISTTDSIVLDLESPPEGSAAQADEAQGAGGASGAPRVTAEYSNSYDEAGLLLEHTGGPIGKVTYEHDAQGRCARISSERWTEQRSYDASGRLELQQIHVPPSPVDTSYGDFDYEIRHEYDERGRVIAVETDGGGVFGTPMDGTRDAWTLRSYRADGSVEVEYVDTLTDYYLSPLPGETRQGRHFFELLSPGCQALEASLPSPASQRCRSD